jgi:hypothetical protein
MARIQADLIVLGASQLRDIKLREARAAELAADVQRVCDAATEVAQQADFNDEPSKFKAVLSRLGDGKSRT